MVSFMIKIVSNPSLDEQFYEQFFRPDQKRTFFFLSIQHKTIFFHIYIEFFCHSTNNYF